MLTKTNCVIRIFFMFFCIVSTQFLIAQNIDVEHIGKNMKDKLKNKRPYKISGGVDASTVFYSGNEGSGRDPFSYYLNGNLNLSLYGINVPVSFSFTNSGFSYRYSLPRTPNRLSLHPKFKWITAHVGDASMSFSPYTLNGVLFTGAGFDLAPKGNWKYSVFYGRLQKAVPYRPDSMRATAAYKRKGYGTKIAYGKGPYKLAFSLFQAKDELNSLSLKPDSLQIYPQQNTAISIDGALPLIKNLVLTTEYGVSLLTRDIRAPKYADSNEVNWLIKMAGARLSTNMFKAMKTSLNYTIGSSMMGVGYERIDPGYQTLGAYYFSNDLENITAQFAQSLFKGKVNFSGNVGLQRDDLKKEKTGGSRRTVAAANLNWNPSQKFTTSVSYSNFQTFTNVKPQFQYINQLTPYDNLDTLNFRQLSQNAMLNVNYVFGKPKENPQNLNLSLSFQDSYDMQGEIITAGNASRFYNLAGAYTRTSVPKSLNLTGAFNLTYNTIGKNEMITMGPTVAASKQLFQKRVRTGASVSYNKSQSLNGAPVDNKVLSMRVNAGYVYKKKHNINLNTVAMRRTVTGKPGKHDLTATLTYNYNF